METINSIFESREEQAFVESEQIRAYFREANDQNLAGALVVSLFAYVLHNLSPVWAWLPGLLCLYAVTAVRAWQMRRYRIAPGSRSSRAWGRGQMIAGALSGLCWGYTNTALLAHAPLEYQFFILTVITVSAAASASEGYSFTPPSEYYIVLSLSPPTLWLFTMGDQLHIVLAAMMLVFLPMTIVQGRKRNQVFIEAQTLRFRNESLARKLKEQRDLAHEASVAKARILAAASHDLRQPIHAITLFLDALDNSRSDADRSRLVVSIRSALTALRELLDTLLDLSKLDAGVVKPNPDIVSVDSLFVEIDNAFSPLALKSGLRFMLWMPRTPLTLRIDRRLLLSVLNNVISNALKNTRRGGVLIGLRRSAADLVFEIWDTGSGISAEHIEHIFDEYYQVDNPHRDRSKGMGLGLAIARRISNLLGLQLSCRSRPEKGSVFQIRIPSSLVVHDHLEPTDVSPRHDEVGQDALQGRRIMLVEDDPLVAAGLSEAMAVHGIGVSIFGSAEAALAAPDLTSVDAFIVDHQLAGPMNGLDFLRTASTRRGKTVKAVVISGNTSPEFVRTVRQLQWPLLFKPVDSRSIFHALGIH